MSHYRVVVAGADFPAWNVTRLQGAACERLLLNVVDSDGVLPEQNIFVFKCFYNRNSQVQASRHTKTNTSVQRLLYSIMCEIILNLLLSFLHNEFIKDYGKKAKISHFF